MREKSQSIFIRLNKNESDQVKALAREHRISAEEVIRRMVVTVLEELEAEDRASEKLPAEERQHLAFEAAKKEVEGWRPEF